MSRTRLPPNPIAYPNLRAWASAFFEFVTSQEDISSRTTPNAVQLPHLMKNRIERATTNGLVMFNPTYQTPVFAMNKAWEPLRAIPSFEVTYEQPYNTNGALVTAGGMAVPFNNATVTVAPWASVDTATGHITFFEGTYYLDGFITLTKGSGGTKYVTGYLADITDLTTPVGSVMLGTLTIDSSAPNDTTFIVPFSGQVAVPTGGKTYALVVYTSASNVYLGNAHNYVGHDNFYAKLNARYIGA